MKLMLKMLQLNIVAFAAICGVSSAYAGPDEDFARGWEAMQGESFFEATEWFRMAAVQGHSAAKTNLGLSYYSGQGVQQDFVESAAWFRAAAEEGNAKAQTNIGYMYNFGKGVPQDYNEAVKWYRMAAVQGNAMAQTNLGTNYYSGHGVARDNVAAYMWWSLGAENGNDLGAQKRDVLAGSMEPADISEAQRRADSCLNSNYLDCE